MPVYRVPIDLTWSGSGSPGVNVWHIRTTGTDLSTQSINEAVGAIRNFYATLVDDPVGDASSLLQSGLRISCQGVMDVETQVVEPVTFDALVAPNAYSMLPPANAMVVSWRTTLAARRGMGRTFIGPMPTNVQESDGTPAAWAVQKLRDAAAALISNSTGPNEWAVGVYGLEDAAPPGTTPEQYRVLPRVLRDITSSSVRDKFAVIRSRRD